MIIDDCSFRLKTAYVNYLAKDEHTAEERIAFLNEAFNAINMLNKVVALASDGISSDDWGVQQANEHHELTQEEKDDQKQISQELKKKQAELNAKKEELSVSEAELETKKKELNEKEAELESVKLEIDDSMKKLADSMPEITPSENVDERAKAGEARLEELSEMDTDELVINELKSAGLSLKLAGCTDILELKNICEKDHTLSIKSDIDDITNALADQCKISKARLIKNIDTLITKADFSKCEFVGRLGKLGNKLTYEEVLLEFIEFYQYEQ